MTITDDELVTENRMLRQQLAGEDVSWYWQAKCHRQRVALDTLNHRVVAQRFVLRTLDELGRGLTREEYLEARARQPEALQERIPA